MKADSDAEITAAQQTAEKLKSDAVKLEKQLVCGFLLFGY